MPETENNTEVKNENADSKVYERYGDIINEIWPKADHCQKMTLNNRAKIFLPFAALTGFEKEIAKRRLAREEKFSKVKSKIIFAEDPEDMGLEQSYSE